MFPESLTCHVEDHIFVSGVRSGEVASIDPGILLPGSSQDENGQGAVVGSVNPEAFVVDGDLLSGGDLQSIRIDIGGVGLARQRLFLEPVYLVERNSITLQTIPDEQNLNRCG